MQGAWIFSANLFVLCLYILGVAVLLKISGFGDVWGPGSEMYCPRCGDTIPHSNETRLRSCLDRSRRKAAKGDSMTVREMIEALQKVENQDRIVVLQKDAEGNGYSPLYGEEPWWEGAYVAETTWYGEAGLESLTDEERACGLDDVFEDGEPALILRPVN